jgi:hypothetical protein
MATEEFAYDRAQVNVRFRNRGAEVCVRSVALVVDGHEYWMAVSPYATHLPLSLKARYGTGSSTVDGRQVLELLDRQHAIVGIKAMLDDGRIVETKRTAEIKLINPQPGWSGHVSS